MQTANGMVQTGQINYKNETGFPGLQKTIEQRIAQDIAPVKHDLTHNHGAALREYFLSLSTEDLLTNRRFHQKYSDTSAAMGGIRSRESGSKWLLNIGAVSQSEVPGALSA